jgi:hypothetical protein
MTTADAATWSSRRFSFDAAGRLWLCLPFRGRKFLGQPLLD